MAILKEFKTAVLSTVVLAVVLCGLYPLAVFLFGQLFYRQSAHGSLIVEGGKIIGSKLIGKDFKEKGYFLPRPSAVNYDPSNSSGSNLGPTSKKLIDTVSARIAEYRRINGLSPDVKIPADAVMASGSGLDPHISLHNARLQLARVAKERGVSQNELEKFLQKNTTYRTLGLLGEPRVNVLLLNLALDVYHK